MRRHRGDLVFAGCGTFVVQDLTMAASLARLEVCMLLKSATSTSPTINAIDTLGA